MKFGFCQILKHLIVTLYYFFAKIFADSLLKKHNFQFKKFCFENMFDYLYNLKYRFYIRNIHCQLKIWLDISIQTLKILTVSYFVQKSAQLKKNVVIVINKYK